MADLREIVRFYAVGVVNTLIGASVILALRYAGFGDFLANAGGYALGLVVSYTLNKHYTFAAAQGSKARFLAVFAGAYGLNVIVLWLTLNALHWNAYICQLLAIISYSVASYVGQKTLVFRREPD